MLKCKFELIRSFAEFEKFFESFGNDKSSIKSAYNYPLIRQSRLFVVYSYDAPYFFNGKDVFKHSDLNFYYKNIEICKFIVAFNNNSWKLLPLHLGRIFHISILQNLLLINNRYLKDYYDYYFSIEDLFVYTGIHFKKEKSKNISTINNFNYTNNKQKINHKKEYLCKV